MWGTVRIPGAQEAGSDARELWERTWDTNALSYASESQVFIKGLLCARVCARCKAHREKKDDNETQTLHFSSVR